MTRVGVTGHQRLRDESTWPWVHQQLAFALDSLAPPLVGLSALAAGADQAFAEMILERGGTLELVLPFVGYREVFRELRARDAFDRLSALATSVRRVPPAASNEDAYLLAGKLVVDASDLVLAVFDGRPSTGVGGTGDIVAYAAQRRVPLVLIDPIQRTVQRQP